MDESKEKTRREEKLAAEIVADYERRKEERRLIERGWQLNINFLNGYQFCDISPSGEIEEEERRFFWQSHRAFNHIAPIMDERLAKLTKLQPKIVAAPFSDEEEDAVLARIAQGIIDGVERKCDMSDVISRATVWSEVCGTAFYKIVWDGGAGARIGFDSGGSPVYGGEVCVIPLSPFEVYPDSLSAEDLDGVRSVIHARAVPCDEIFRLYGVRVEGEDIGEFSLSPISYSTSLGSVRFGGGNYVKRDCAVVVERYTRPTAEYPLGRFEVACGKRLLYEGDLPFVTGGRGERGLPFVIQRSIKVPAGFYGASIIDRLIPLQRAYNAVRNRKHEFLNRLSLGVVAVEDGSVDTDELSDGGLAPGKVLIYRQGSTPPAIMDTGAIPSEFAVEEERLEKEFLLVGESSDVSRNEENGSVRVTSATGLQLLLDQYDEKISAVTMDIRRAVCEIYSHSIKLYRQFAPARAVGFAGEGKEIGAAYFLDPERFGDDVVLQAEDKTTPEKKREEIIRLMELGLLSDGDGNIPDENKNRILEALGFASFCRARDLSDLHENKAAEENLALASSSAPLEVDEYDDDDIHISAHVRYLLSDEFKKLSDRAAVKERFLKHIRLHKAAKGGKDYGKEG